MRAVKPKTGIVLLSGLCLVLLAAWLFRHQSAERQKRDDRATIQNLSNEWNKTSALLTSQTEVNNVLTANLQTKTAELQSTAAQLVEARTNLANTQKEVRETKEQLETARGEIAQHNTRITQLENQNLALDKQANELKAAIAELETRIADTQRKLAKSEGDRDFLLKELKRLQAEKTELERKFTDLVVLREQVKKLKEGLAISRRLEWIRKGLYGQPKKGAELLQGGFGRPGAQGRTNANLNVEIRRDGTSTILSPTNAPTGTGPNR